MSENYHNYQLLLAKAARLYERHGVGRPEPLHTNFRRKYMDALKQLCLEDNNFVLVHDLNDVMLEAIREAIWSEIEAELRSEEPDFIDASVSKDGLSYELNEVSQIHVGAHGKSNDGRIWFGVSCSEKDPQAQVRQNKKITGELLKWWRTRHRKDVSLVEIC